MITIEELSIKVEQEFANDQRNLILWNDMKRTLTPHVEQIPGEPYLDEYGNENWDYEEEVCSYADTYEDELAYFCWKCGCSLYTHIDWVDGSPSYCVTLPETEEEYQKNLEEADAWWKEVM